MCWDREAVGGGGQKHLVGQGSEQLDAEAAAAFHVFTWSMLQILEL